MALASVALAAVPTPQAIAADCSTPIAYPGDSAQKSALARWMAHGARARTIPGELPVMGALVESGLTNLDPGGADSVGFFQMRTSIWNQGEYAGYPDHPDLQLEWFLDQASALRDARLAAGVVGYGQDPATWGEWAADVLRPAAQYRDRYQLRLGEARNLVGADCSGFPRLIPPPPPPPADVTPPAALLSGARVQKAGRSIVMTASCGSEACTAVASGYVSVPGAARVFKLRSAKKRIAARSKVKMRLRVSKRAQRAIRRALRGKRKIAARIKLRVADAAGNARTTRRTVKLRR
jgi:hypothetical protein